MMAPRRKKPDDAELKAAIVDAALPHVPFDGFTDKVLRQAGEEAGADRETIARLFPEGALSLVEACSSFADEELERRLSLLDLKSLKVRERIGTAVLTRLDILRPQKDAARRAAAFLSLPPHLPLATRLLYRTVDVMWRAAGDTATDFNFYTKRAILAGVWSATLLRWFNDTTEHEQATRDFLAARIDNVMAFEKFKAEVAEGFARLPSLSDVLSSIGERTGGR
jgi:ubiquinone biosynthesis protein COQ9